MFKKYFFFFVNLTQLTELYSIQLGTRHTRFPNRNFSFEAVARSPSFAGLFDLLPARCPPAWIGRTGPGRRAPPSQRSERCTYFAPHGQGSMKRSPALRRYPVRLLQWFLLHLSFVAFLCVFVQAQGHTRLHHPFFFWLRRSQLLFFLTWYILGITLLGFLALYHAFNDAQTSRFAAPVSVKTHERHERGLLKSEHFCTDPPPWDGVCRDAWEALGW